MRSPQPPAPNPLVDRLGRVHTDLRVSVTDRCNLRCFYCMPAEGVEFRSHQEVLRYEEIERFVRVAARLGIRKVRLTGGEPLVRKGVVALVEMLARVPGIDDLAMTTNGILLAQHAEQLKAAGLMRLNVSIDTLDPEKFRLATGRDALGDVLAGIAAARRAGFRRIKLNALAIRGRSEEDVVPLARFAREQGLTLRFIEFMPLDGCRQWQPGQVLSAAEILDLLAAEFGPLEPVSDDGSAAAREYRFSDGGDRIGVVPSVSRPFCDRCNRLRLTSDGRLRNCLFAVEGTEVRELLRGGASDERIAEAVREAVRQKLPARGSSDASFARTRRTMHEIGG